MTHNTHSRIISVLIQTQARKQMTKVVQMILDEDDIMDIQTTDLDNYSGGCQPYVQNGKLVHDDFNFLSTCAYAQTHADMHSNVQSWMKEALNNCDCQLSETDVDVFARIVAHEADMIGFDNIARVELVHGSLETELEFSGFILTK